MIRFRRGPANGLTLALKRAPLYLRVARSRRSGEWDALDQLNDEPKPNETLFVYRRIGAASYCMLDWTEKGKRRGGRFASGIYVPVAEQPIDEIARDTQRWRDWCYRQQKRDAETAAGNSRATEAC